MALLTLDGFDNYGSETDVERGGWTRQEAVSFSTTGGRFGGGHISVDDDSPDGWRKAIVMGDDTFVCGVAFKLANVLTADSIFETYNNAGADICLKLNVAGNGSLALFNALGVLQATSAINVLTPNIWHYLEIKVTGITNASTSTVTVRIDESVIFGGAVSSVQTSQGAFTVFDSVRFTSNRNNNIGAARWDDVVIMDGTGAQMNDFIGDARIDVKTVDSDGTSPSTDWDIGGSVPAATRRESVDDALGAHDDGVTVIESDTVGRRSQFGLINTTAVGTIHALAVLNEMGKDDAGARTARSYLDSNGTIANGATQTLTIEKQAYRDFHEVNPDGGAAWTPTTVDAVEVGVEVVT